MRVLSSARSSLPRRARPEPSARAGCGSHACSSHAGRALLECAAVVFFFSSRRRHTRYWRDWSSDVCSSDLWAQLEAVDAITDRRRRVWDAYHEAFAQAEADGHVRRPVVPEHCVHNAHLYHLLVTGPTGRDELIGHLAERGVQAVFHYVPLHSAPAGRRLGRAHGSLEVTDRVSAQIVRLPLWAAMQDHHVEQVAEGV